MQIHWKILLLVSLCGNLLLGAWYFLAKPHPVPTGSGSTAKSGAGKEPEMHLEIDFSKTGLSDAAWKVPAPDLSAEGALPQVEAPNFDELSLLPTTPSPTPPSPPSSPR